ncbi:hypothetical protein HID58_066685 [Brassica napus]|uniref:DUF223 domain-containing protein n=1 Tax=Brassica napus TaxID=3708 RepID=A0ABQ7ZGV7_BRANA|nr:hypothetical protein HID58_066685 [Brassica napus]
MAGFDEVSQLKPYKSMWRIKVKIIRMWKQYTAQGGETIEMVLVDSKGDKIHASVKKDLVEQFDPVLMEGFTKILINFAVTHACGSYRTTKHAYKIAFVSTTKVRPCEELPMNLTGFTPAKFLDVLDGSLNTDYLVDVIGQIVEFSHVEIVSVNGKDTEKITVELRNENDVRLTIVLWGKFAMNVSDAIQLRADHAVVCVLRFGKIKVWKEDRSVSNAYNVSDIAINPSMNEVQAFLALLPKDGLPLAIVEAKALPMVSMISEKEDFFIHTPRKTISEVLESRQTERCIVMCTIAAIESDMVCSKKVQTVPNDNDDGGFKYFCTKCKVYTPKMLPRYKLHLVVLDNTSNTKFLLFDNLGLQLLNQPCIELTGKVTDEVQNPDALPIALTNLVGKTYLFKIVIEKENYLYKHDTYKVLKIITNADMINEFDVNHYPSGSESTVCPQFSNVSEAPEGSMMILGSSSQVSESNSLTPAKRSGTPIMNLEESFDQNSVTKTNTAVRIKKEKIEKSG